MIKFKITVKTDSKTIKIKKEYDDFSEWCMGDSYIQEEILNALAHPHQININKVKSITMKIK